MNYMFNEMVKLIQYDYIMRSEVFSTNAFIQICNFSMHAALFRRLACRPAAFLAVWGRQRKSATDFCRLRFGVFDYRPFEAVPHCVHGKNSVKITEPSSPLILME